MAILRKQGFCGHPVSPLTPDNDGNHLSISDQSGRWTEISDIVNSGKFSDNQQLDRRA